MRFELGLMKVTVDMDDIFYMDGPVMRCLLPIVSIDLTTSRLGYLWTE